ncbi:Gfo/Idh/MocA family protein [Tenggerimyces flavus]|uniref:Gfo/Idh/MocA family protein n=1 Tax=Tenggerimyces flavus TaxID=1708749 RepID=A0ABV7YFV8_9ACTN|nr:Gfo/Idh/MocA family oxidoreductase [Tenggerimyces flavus]MBM7788176.1 putative dehydrogenase [Tenggerimyces flavus]
MARTRVGILGLGSVGRTHAKALARLADQAELVAVSGGASTDLTELGWPDAERTSHDALLERSDLDLVAICGPSALHAEQAIRALKAGSDVVVEKPLALTVKDAKAVAATAKETGRQVSVVSQRRLEPQNQYLKVKLDAGELGTPILGEAFLHWHRDDAYYAHAPWRSKQNEGGGSLFNQAVHNVDLLTWLLGPVAEVTAQYGTLGHAGLDTEDTTVATLRFASNALGVVVSTTATKPGDPARLVVYTSKGTIELANAEVTRWDIPGVPPPPTPSTAKSGASDPAAIGVIGHETQWRDVLAAFRDGRPPAVTAEAGLATVRLLCAIYEAADSGRATPAGG